MKRLKGILGTLLIFVSGVVVGVVLASGAINDKIRSIAQGGPDRIVEAVASNLRKQLKLDQGQQEMLKHIVVDTRIKLRVVSQKTRPEMNAVLREAENQVRAILNPEQVKKFEQILVKQRQGWEPSPTPAPSPVPAATPTAAPN